jgi:hypothetical protein
VVRRGAATIIVLAAGLAASRMFSSDSLAPSTITVTTEKRQTVTVSTPTDTSSSDTGTMTATAPVPAPTDNHSVFGTAPGDCAAALLVEGVARRDEPVLPPVSGQCCCVTKHSLTSLVLGRSAGCLMTSGK